MATAVLNVMEGKQPSLKRLNKWVKKHHDELVMNINKELKCRKVLFIHEIHQLSFLKTNDNKYWIDVEFEGLDTDIDATKAAQDMWRNGMSFGFNITQYKHEIKKKSSLLWY